ncbi:hypothetical protein [Sphingomonas sanxanigenens]|uniref:Uncharacterized protein n=1 Tax=Sphingomonas sanxanigenens DSM 19645 = NX02 TaxID=1123269 RepID=W0AJE0_9SPHN|nr:hypothetical protein [Sphingomonas sanxanigenens]AHE56667.1 hypothetical protein NX02_25300 [Sphingomonas sanxanigenens DSM 19645 = NX02]
MPLSIAPGTIAPITLDELVDRLEQPDFDPRDEACFASFGPWLAALARNRDFLGRMAVDEIKSRLTRQQAINRYSSQVMMLHRPRSSYFIRANFWPSAGDTVVRDSGIAPFFYGVPHDHNFSFLTVGYAGPGYWSDYYDYDPGSVAGRAGEPAALRFVERSRLAEGRVLLYRAHRDVHDQAPADAFSVSINIMELNERQVWRDQFRFDVVNGRIDGILNTAPATALLALAAHLGGDGRDLLDHVAATHPSSRMRVAAIEAVAASEGDAVWQRWAGDTSRLVRETSRAYCERIDPIR